MTLELALDTFGDVSLDAEGRMKPQDAVIRDVVDQAVLADEVGVDFIGLGEHHRDDFAISSPEVILGAIAARTSRIRLGTAVTVLSSDDPIRLFQRFSTLHALSSGRGEVILGRGSFTESFPLFGFDLRDYETLFNEKLDLFTRLLRERAVSWSGTIRPALRNQPVYPTLAQPLRAWIGVGGTPESVMRAVRHDLPMMLAIIGGSAARFRPFVDLYHRAADQAGNAPQPIGAHSPGHVAETDEAAKEELWPHYRLLLDRIGRERGWSPITRDRFEAEAAEGALYVGSPETVARKIAGTVRALGLSRFEMKYSSGPMPHGTLMRSIELYGSRVIPLVRDMLA
jgi:probable LLM family oxidoreductase